jgi:hypothetical protein
MTPSSVRLNQRVRRGFVCCMIALVELLLVVTFGLFCFLAGMGLAAWWWSEPQWKAELADYYTRTVWIQTDNLNLHRAGL